jgi:O-antigen ligase
MTALVGRVRPADSIAPMAMGAAALATFALLGVAAVVSPLLALAAVLAMIFVAIAFRDLAAGVALFAVTTFFGHLPGTGTGSSVEVTVVKLTGAVLLLAWLLLLVRRTDVPLLLLDHPFIAFSLAAFQIWAFSSALWAQDATTAMTTSLRYGQNFLLVFIVYSALREARHFRWLLWAFMLAALISVVIALASGPAASAVGSAAVASVTGSQRLTGRFGAGDANLFASLLLPALVFAAFSFVAERKIAIRAALVTLAVLFTVGLFQTESRGGLVALAATAVVSLFVTGRLRRRALVATVLAAVMTVTYFGVIASPESRARVTRLHWHDSSGRDDLWKIGLAMAGDHPALGVGSGNFTLVSPMYGQKPFDLVYVNYVVDTPKVAHNTYLNILDELGIPGLVILGAIVAGALAAASRAVRAMSRAGDSTMETFGRAIVLASIGILIASFFFSGQYQKQLWLLLGAAVALSSPARNSTRNGDRTADSASARLAERPVITV